MEALQRGVDDWTSEIGLSVPSLAVIIAAAILVCLLLWLVLRSLRLWYWKVNEQIDTLRSIDSRLKSVENQIAEEQIKDHGIEENRAGERKENFDGAVECETGCMSQSKVGAPCSDNVGRDGTIYTEQELEAQIRE